MSKPLVSILIPSRGRPGPLTATVKSIRETGDAEIIVRADADDASTIEAARELPVKLIIGPRHPPQLYHRFYDEMLGESRGQWLWIFNDDAIIETAGWSERIERDFIGTIGTLRIHDCRSLRFPAGENFPIVPREVFAAMGRIADHPDVGRWLADVMVDFPIYLLGEIRVKHRNLQDATKSEVDAGRRAIGKDGYKKAVRLFRSELTERFKAHTIRAIKRRRT